MQQWKRSRSNWRLQREGKENKSIEKIQREEQKRIVDHEKQKLRKEEKKLAKKRKKEEAEQSLLRFEQKEEVLRLQDEKFTEIHYKPKKDVEAAE
ncbi:uncharacterized protein MONOS_16956 [Monocercomonoides exilis]|uniref:uncharacterized protein n=1 Tax=Monocercomonoides exilis TaxID=2049356 RepID=UPI0035599341|nr:hypothetical protein MONOS_6049 [Monocercomonoides exilis]KAH7831349.1 hypothetical protein MONOS_16956 [Monocercomonoides exilis]|eukprot:MONOS_6049.1-p1 / transcript=MONOS_6049.1 / gene=MONOS_6049 / organism=Monocercomonoides_exilis_PA203 / gene_product=unspecified product / transcript_product=unspecified product / location=Mono_scaffold00185:74478-74762(+) / protein_length=95 / sequence_SO=supercontig / SO=protein_coding / is_pseudo=false